MYRKRPSSSNATRVHNGLAAYRIFLGLLRSLIPPHDCGQWGSVALAQVPAGERDEDILQARMPRHQVQQAAAVPLQVLQQRRQRQVRRGDGEADDVLVLAPDMD